MARRIRRLEWEATSLGSLGSWPGRLKGLVDLVLGSEEPMFLAAGSELVMIYNDAHAAFIAGKHPSTLGRPILEAFAEVRDDLAPRIARVLSGRQQVMVDEHFDLPWREDAPEGWFTAIWTPIRGDRGEVAGFLATVRETTAGVLAQAAMRDSENRKTYLLRLADALRPLGDPVAIQSEASRLLGEFLGAARVMYGEVEPDGEHIFFERSYFVSGQPDLAGRYRMADFGPSLVDALSAGKTVSVGDIAAAPELTPTEREAYGTLGIRAIAGVPLTKGGRFVANLNVHAGSPRAWSPEDLALIEETAERTWAALQRARAEARLRESEERYRLIVDSARDYAILTLRGDGTIASWSAGAEAVLGWTAEEAIGRDVAVTFTAEDNAAGAPEAEREVARREGFAPDVRWHRRNDGTRAFIEGSIRPLQGEGGPATGFLKIGQDVTERRRILEALQASEERFRQFAAASTDVLWIRNAATMDMEFVSPAFESVYGTPGETVLGDLRNWAALIVPDDRQAALANLEEARAGRPVVHEFRIMRPSDGAFRWIRNHDFPLHDENGRVVRIGGIATDHTEMRQLAAHQEILLAELQHRVRNIMAKIRVVASMTGRTAGSVEQYERLVSSRLMALARTQALLTRAANAGVDVRGLVADEIDAQAEHRLQYEVDGPAIAIHPKAAEVLSLAVHELTTNALKYGALSVPEGRIRATWSVALRDGEPWLVFRWSETRAPSAAIPPGRGRRGFGTQLIEDRIPYELRGRGKLDVRPDGVECMLEFPLRDGASILETDAPLPRSVHGGMLDMGGEPRLSGQLVLVLEDDFYIASDTARAMRGVGALVAGPFPTEDAALEAIERQPPTAALLDIDLGQGASFAVAARLQELGIPFVFLTGYDHGVIPEAFGGVVRLEKPVDLRQIVRAVARLTEDAPARH